MSERPSRPLSLLVGPYRLLEKLGAGGMASVYKARDTRSDRLVAVKILTSLPLGELDPVNIKRFHREFAVASQLRHRHLVRAFDHGEIEGKLYVVMEYVEGQDLAVQLREQGPLPLDKALILFRQIGAALSYLHRQRVVHRDIKPANILLTGRTAKLTDLGLVKRLVDERSQLTCSKACLGTMEYGAPEQFEDAREVDERCDLYSLAATFYHALSGDLPFGTGSYVRVLRRKICNSFLPLSERGLLLCPALDRFITSALHAQREQRPSSCDAFLAALEEQSLRSSDDAVRQPALPQRQPAQASERRTEQRHLVSLRASCEPHDAKARQIWESTIADISQQGCKLTLGAVVKCGDCVQVLLSRLTAGTLAGFLARVCWVKEHGKELWAHGCKLIHPLSAEQLRELLNEATFNTVVLAPERNIVQLPSHAAQAQAGR